MDKSTMIQEILITMKANNLYISGDLFLTLAFRSVLELQGICQALHIQTNK